MTFLVILSKIKKLEPCSYNDNPESNKSVIESRPIDAINDERRMPILIGVFVHSDSLL
jgi:hypothetical protein